VTEQVTLFIDEEMVRAEAGAPLLFVARAAGRIIPSLCRHAALLPFGACRLCMVELERPDLAGPARLVPSCMVPARNDLVVRTVSDRIAEARRVRLDVLLAAAPEAKAVRDLAAEYGLEQTTLQIAPEGGRCVECGLCVRICREVVGASAIGSWTLSAAECEEGLGQCIGCGACAWICPADCLDMESTKTRDLRLLPGSRRPCRYALMGLVPGAICANDYQCWRCEVDQAMTDRIAPSHPVFLAKGRMEKGR